MNFGYEDLRQLHRGPDLIVMMNLSHKLSALLAVVMLIATTTGLAQEPTEAKASQGKVTLRHSASTKVATNSHKFWDGENVAVFTGVAAVRALDFTSTQHFRVRGVNEILLTNGIVDNKPLFAGIEIAGTAVSIGLCYWLHRKGHHRAERWVSIVHIGVGTFGDIRNYGLSNPQFAGAMH